MNEEVIPVKAQFDRACERLLKSFHGTREDKMNWSPSETSRSPIAVLAHCAGAIGFLTGILSGQAFSVSTTEEADKMFRASELGIQSKEQALALFEENSKKFISFLEGLDDEKLDTLVEFPFGFGKLPVRTGMVFPAYHTESHVGQLDYIHTIYGDHTWY